VLHVVPMITPFCGWGWFSYFYKTSVELVS
jgi:hypothetical protein